MSELLSEIEAFVARHKLEDSTFGRMVGDRHIVQQLRAGRRMWPETIARVRARMAEIDAARCDPRFSVAPDQVRELERWSAPPETLRNLPFAVDPRSLLSPGEEAPSSARAEARSSSKAPASRSRPRPSPNSASETSIDSVDATVASPSPAADRWAGRTVQCSLCERRLSETTVRACQAPDCPHSDREAA